MTPRRFIMNAGRTTKQGQQINVGKDHAEYQALVSTLIMHPDDMRDVGIVAGGIGPGPIRDRRGCFSMQGGESSSGNDFRPLWPADLPSHGPETPTEPACPPPKDGRSRSSRLRRKPRRSLLTAGLPSSEAPSRTRNNDFFQAR